MVKVDNVFGDVWMGKVEHMVYQRKGNINIRRLDPEKEDPKSPSQIEQRERFKAAVELWKNLSTTEKDSINQFFNSELTAQEKNKYLHAYNLVKAYRMQRLQFSYTEQGDTFQFRFYHPFLSNVKIYDANNLLVSSVSTNLNLDSYSLPQPINITVNKYGLSHALVTYADNTQETVSLPYKISPYPTYSFSHSFTAWDPSKFCEWGICFAHGNHKYELLATSASDYPPDPKLFDVESGQYIRTYEANYGRGRGVDVSPNSTYAIIGAGGFDTYERLYYFDPKSLKCTIGYRSGWYDSFPIFNPTNESQVIVHFTYVGMVSIYNTNCGLLRDLPQIRSVNNRNVINFSANGDLLVVNPETSYTSSYGSYLYLFDTSGNVNDWYLKGSVQVASSGRVAKEPGITNDNKYIICGMDNSSWVRYYDTNNLSSYVQVNLPAGYVVSFARNMRRHPFQIVLTKSPNRVYILKGPSVKYYIDLPSDKTPYAVDVSDDGKYLAVNLNNMIYVYKDPNYVGE